MKDLFNDSSSKKIIEAFENAVENFHGGDHHFLYDVSIDLEVSYFHYKHENVDYAFQIYLRTIKLTDELYQYLINDVSPVDLKSSRFVNKL
jgi:hypothetical protein